MATLTNRPQTLVIKEKDFELHLLATGDIFKWMHGDHQVNLIQGNVIDGMMSNLYLREHFEGQYQSQKLLGIHSPSHWQLTDHGAIYQGEWRSVHYRVELILQGTMWFYLLELSGGHPLATYDVFYGQDVGISHPFGILSNEAYTSQYIDHQIFQQDQGYTILSRQNQGKTHYLQIGCDYPTVGYVTDAMQFFGVSYKLHHEAMALTQPRLANQNYQYESAYPTLQTQSFSLGHQPTRITFYAYSHQEQDALYTQPLKLPFPYPIVPGTPTQSHVRLNTTLQPHQPLSGIPFEEDALRKRYPNQTLIEQKDGITLSSFLPNDIHLVTRHKELLMERPHGHILLSGDVLHASENVFATTAYMSGIFGSHTVYGNTNFHKLTGDLRHPLNVHTISGTRIWIWKNQRYHLLGLPSVFLMGLTSVSWIYQWDDDVLTVRLSVDGSTPGSRLTVTSERQKTYKMLLSQQYLLDTNEYQHPITYEVTPTSIVVKAIDHPMIASAYPGLSYRMTASSAFTLATLSHFIEGLEEDDGMLFLQFQNIDALTLVTEASFSSQFLMTPLELGVQDTYSPLIKQLIPLSFHGQVDESLASFQALIPWYVHDALVHYASPHGLEQYNGAAWGTRDVLQGPFELFLTAQRFDLNREILLKVFSRQFSDNHEFPQWFMFDHYRHIQAYESHGDVLVWPLKALASYLHATDDTSILDEFVPFMDKATGQFTTTKIALRDHVQAILERLQSSHIQGTHLPAYGGGDWDDTLQPANAALTQQMVSGWTVALLYEALHGLSPFTIFNDARQTALIAYEKNILNDYNRYLIVDGIPAGFVVFYEDHQEVLLHPRDQSTGLTYRLLPFNRGMISEVFSPHAITTYQAIIRHHLRHPDGVRLMNTSVRYQGGKKTYFQRAETAANFGREISIQYVHAHIRYIEAMCRIGNHEEAWWGLQVINPISMQHVVPNAMMRQRNVYFSSSDAMFLNRYEANQDFERVRQGMIPVKAGWRLYSSGPGIYLQTFIQQFLGIRIEKGSLLMDPMLPESLTGVTVTYQYRGKPLKIHYTKSSSLVPFNSYRQRRVSSLQETKDGFVVSFS